jgi:hypothetical protein
MLTPGAEGRTSEPLECSSSSSRLSREQVLDRIISINPTATLAFLERFSEQRLEKYLDHLVAASGPRGGHSRWMRPGDAPAIWARVAQD